MIVFLRFYRHYTGGFLPSAGGTLNQPSTFMMAIDALEFEIAEFRGEDEERRKRRRG